MNSNTRIVVVLYTMDAFIGADVQERMRNGDRSEQARYVDAIDVRWFKLCFLCFESELGFSDTNLMQILLLRPVTASRIVAFLYLVFVCVTVVDLGH